MCYIDIYFHVSPMFVRIEEKKEPRMTYRERKAREQMVNARDNRKKWENREEESGDKDK